MEEVRFTVDDKFISSALTVALQMRDQLPEDQYINIIKMQVLEDGTLEIFATKNRMTVN